MNWLKKLFGVREDAATPGFAYQNPLDGKTYAGNVYVGQGADGASAAGTPPAAPVEQHVKMGALRLLTLEKDVAARADVQDIVAFVGRVHRLAEDQLGKSSKPFMVLVQFTCRPSAHDIQLAHQGDASEDLLNAFYTALKAVDPLPVRADEVAFQMEMSIESAQ